MKTKDKAPAAPAGLEAEALIEQARRRQRRRRWVSALGVAAVIAVVLVVLASAGAGIWGRSAAQGGKRPPGAGAVPELSGRARITYRVVTAGVPEAYGTDDITFSGKNRILSVSATTLARGPSPAQTLSGTERIVDGQVYDYSRVDGLPSWVREPDPSYVSPKIIDPRALLRVLAPYTRFRAAGDQVVGGIRLKVLRATDPASLTRRALLPAVYTSGQPVASLELRVDRHGVVHQMAFTFRAPANRIALSKPVSEAALRAYLRAERAQARIPKTGKRVPESRMRLAQRRVDQAELRAFPVRQGTQVTATTVTFSAIGQLQHITAPPHAVP
jgi:hypothetical protein